MILLLLNEWEILSDFQWEQSHTFNYMNCQALSSNFSNYISDIQGNLQHLAW